MPGATAGKARLAIGSYRLWLTDDWDPLSPAVPLMFWRTLPTARDPYATPAQLNFDQDKIDESAGNVISVKWLDRGTVNGTQFQNSKLLVLYERAIVRIYQVDGIDKWDHEILAWSKKKRISEDSDIPAGGAPSEKLPWEVPVPRKLNVSTVHPASSAMRSASSGYVCPDAAADFGPFGNP